MEFWTKNFDLINQWTRAMEMFKDMPKFLKSLNLKCLIVILAISTSFQLFAPPPPPSNLAIITEETLRLPDLGGTDLYIILGVARDATEDAIQELLFYRLL